MKKSLVFCEGCRYYESLPCGEFSAAEVCTHPSRECVYRTAVREIRYAPPCSQANEGNNCTLREDRPAIVRPTGWGKLFGRKQEENR